MQYHTVPGSWDRGAWSPSDLDVLLSSPLTLLPCLQTLPIVVFFSCVMSILYYLGVMQWLIVKVGPHT